MDRMPQTVRDLLSRDTEPANETHLDVQAFDLSPDELAEVWSAIGRLDSAPYEKWLTVGMALYEMGGGSDELFKVWDNWSARADNYDRAIMRKRWRGFASERPDKITEATFWKMAREAGHTSPPCGLVFQPVAGAIKTVTHAQLMDREFGPVKWGIKDLLPQGVAMLAAKPKIGKSWLALQMCGAKAAGRPLWNGRDPEDVGGALYLALEDNHRRLQSRSAASFPYEFSETQDGPLWRVKGLANLHFATEWPRIGAGGIRQLRDWLGQHPECELVVVDTWARIREKITGKASYNDDYKLGEVLKPISDEFGVTILIIHHTRKQDADDPLDLVSGTQGVAGSVDTVLVLSRLRGSGQAQLFVAGRDIEESPDMALQFEKESCCWKSTGVSVREAQLEEGRQNILDVIRRAEVPQTIREIRSALSEDGISAAGPAIRKTVQRMVNDNQLEKVEGHKYDIAAEFQQ